MCDFSPDKRNAAVDEISFRSNFTGEQFRARGYCVSTAGYEEDKVRADIGEQEGGDGGGRF
jgi:REP element-mobilizing transposase RayT